MNKNSLIRLLLLGGILVSGGILAYIYLLSAPQPPIYGITHNLNGGGGFQIVDIDINTGKESNPRSIKYQAFPIPNVFGIARKYVQNVGQNEAVLSVLEDNIGCGSGTAFYYVDINTGTAFNKLGTALPLNPNLANTWIEDIRVVVT